MPSKSTSRYLAFLDECGDHSLGRLDTDFPIFVLSTVIVERTAYAERIIPSLARLKLSFWAHEGFNLHSRDIRRASGDFAFMQLPERRESMYRAINQFMSCEFTLFITAIRKDELLNRGRNGDNPYSLALSETLRGVGHFMREHGESALPFIAESRGWREDQELLAAFSDFVDRAERIDNPNHPVIFGKKTDNIAGLQMADLSAYPYARQFLGGRRRDPALDVLTPHIYHNGAISGLTLLP